MFSAFNNLLGYGTDSDPLAKSTAPQAYAYGYDPPTAGTSHRGQNRDDPGASQDLPSHHINPQRTQNVRGTFMVPHTGRVFAQHDNIDPYHWPSIQDPDIRPPERALPPISSQQTAQAPQFNHTDRWTVIFDKDQDNKPDLKRNISSRDRILQATQRKRSVQEEQQDRPDLARNQSVREKRGPPIAYNIRAAHVERVVDSTRDRPYLTRSGSPRESQNAAGVETLINTLRDRLPPSRSGSLNETRRNGSLDSTDRFRDAHPATQEGRKVSFDTMDRPGISRYEGRKFSFDSAMPRNDLNRTNSENTYSLFPKRKDSLDHRKDSSSTTGQSNDLLRQHTQTSPPPRLPSLDFGRTALPPRPESHQLFNSQYYHDNSPSTHSQAYRNQTHLLTPPSSTYTSPTKTNSTTRPEVIHLHRTDGTTTAVPRPDSNFSLRESLLFGELQSWTAKTVSLYNYTEVTCCQCEKHYPLCTEGHKEGWDLRPFHCYGGPGWDCSHIPCSTCSFSLGLRKMPLWPTRPMIEENKELFGSVKWTWLCCCCGTPKRTDSPVDEEALSWKGKWGCEGCGNGWCEHCPTFLIGNDDFYELNRVAASLLVKQQRGVPQTTPVEEVVEEEKGKLTLIERMEKVVVKAAGKLKKLVVGKAEELRPRTGKSAKSFGGHRHKSRKGTVKRPRTGKSAKSVGGHRHRSWKSGGSKRRGSTPAIGMEGLKRMVTRKVTKKGGHRKGSMF